MTVNAAAASKAIAGTARATSRPPSPSTSDATAGPTSIPSASPLLITALPATSSSGVRASPGSSESVAGRFTTAKRPSTIAATKTSAGGPAEHENRGGREDDERPHGVDAGEDGGRREAIGERRGERRSDDRRQHPQRGDESRGGDSSHAVGEHEQRDEVRPLRRDGQQPCRLDARHRAVAEDVANRGEQAGRVHRCQRVYGDAAVSLRDGGGPSGDGAHPSRSDDQKGRHGPVALQVDRAARLQLELLAEEAVCRLADLDSTRHALLLQAAGHVHRVAPDVEGNLALADDPAHRDSRMDADPEIDRAQRASVTRCLIDHCQPELDNPRRVPVERFREAAGRHVAVPDGLDLLEAPCRDEVVE